MKNLLLIILFSIAMSCHAQTYPLRTFTDIPNNAYLKDTNDELLSYQGTWKGNWDGKTILITFKKITNKYNENLKYYSDILIGKFKVLDISGNILYDNTNMTDDNMKIWGGKFRKLDDKYSLIYIDSDVCNTSGNIIINFTDSSKTKLNWKYSKDENWIDSSCPYYNSNSFPEPLPKEMY